jgi:EAL domain-containing protein (putative c-di-GMP-specific phosphodiesterase class I)
VDVASGSILGVEALIRWNHPDLGVVSPAQFIPVAEESGLIVPISAWVLRTACAQAAEWRQSLGHAPRMSVNISALHFRHRDFVEMVTGSMDQAGIDPGALELELTESVVMQDADATVAKLTALRRKGVGLAIDDFGTGYSSLSYLKRFPLDRLKIDQSFVRDIGHSSDSEAIIQAIVGMAHSLRLQTVAEGVETREQLKFLHSLGCDQLQGYLFSRPVPAAEIPPLIGRGPQPL